MFFLAFQYSPRQKLGYVKVVFHSKFPILIALYVFKTKLYKKTRNPASKLLIRVKP